VLGVDCTLHVVFSLKSCANKVLHKERVSACENNLSIGRLLYSCTGDNSNKVVLVYWYLFCLHVMCGVYVVGRVVIWLTVIGAQVAGSYSRSDPNNTNMATHT
jgi:hypothetical protein